MQRISRVLSGRTSQASSQSGSSAAPAASSAEAAAPVRDDDSSASEAVEERRNARERRRPRRGDRPRRGRGGGEEECEEECEDMPMSMVAAVEGEPPFASGTDSSDEDRQASARNVDSSDDDCPASSVPPPPVPVPADGLAASVAAAAVKPSCYALADEEYEEWKQALEACRKSPTSLEPLQALSSKPKLLNWRSPVTGQTLLHEIAFRGATVDTIEGAVQLGCVKEMPNSKGETADTVARRKQGIADGGRRERPSSVLQRPGRNRAPRSQVRGYGAEMLQEECEQMTEQCEELTEERVRLPEKNTSSTRTRGGPMSFLSSLIGSGTQEKEQRPMSWGGPPQLQQRAAPRSSPMPGPSASSAAASSAAPASSAAAPASSYSGASRKRGKCLKEMEYASVPKAQMALDLDLAAEEELDREQLEKSIQQAYGGKVRVQIDEARERSMTENRARGRSDGGKWQNVKCRVMFDSASEAAEWQGKSSRTRDVQASLAQALNISGGDAAVAFDAEAKVAEVDAITLKLDSDSSSILCGACLAYTQTRDCEKVIHYSDRHYYGGVISHSGDTQVDGKSVHTISLQLSKVPAEITQLYFTLCSCGPANLSGFKNPNIMLYENSQPDANLLEYTIGQAGNSTSCVMARMVRQLAWKRGDLKVIARGLRQRRMPLLAIDLCLAMAEETSWAIQALGTEAWHLTDKICGSYGPAKSLIELRLASGTAGGTTSVGVGGAAAAGRASAVAALGAAGPAAAPAAATATAPP